jgi:hypothetical protein
MAETKVGWQKYTVGVVASWRETLVDAKSLPGAPFVLGAQSRTRYELSEQFVVRSCFETFEKMVLDAQASCNSMVILPRVSILGPKGSGKTTFFRWFVSKHCCERLVVYINEPSSLQALNKTCVKSLIFGLQALGPDNTAASQLLEKVLKWSTDITFDMFHTNWGNLVEMPDFKLLLEGAIIVVDQLKREGDVFDLFAGLQFNCSLYILVSSSGVLHHHNLEDGFQKRTYDYPVGEAEFKLLTKIHEEVLVKSGPMADLKSGESELTPNTFATVLLAWSMIETGGTVDDFVITAALKFYEAIKSDSDHLAQVVALIVSCEGGFPVEGITWECALDSNYFDITDRKMVRFHFPAYLTTLKRLVMGSVAYASILRTLLCSQEIVDRIDASALGVHVEAVLHLTWKEHMVIGWNQCYPLPSGVRGNGKRRNEQVVFKVQLCVEFNGDFPEGWQLLEWMSGGVKVLYLKPNKPNYWGFDMFIVQLKGVKVQIHAVQVTVSMSREHSVEAFFKDGKNFERNWEELLKLENTTVEWNFHMLTPETEKSGLPPGREGDDRFDQISFRDLVDAEDCVETCGVAIVKGFPALLEQKKQNKKLKQKAA